jgi:endonuclease/exonuclease/phosphatase family metal-dependent hydrolase
MEVMRGGSMVLGALLLGATSVSLAQLRICTYNVTDYSSGRVADFQNIMYGTFDGRRLAPDVIVGQEFLSQAGVDNFRNLLNSAVGSPGDWQSAPFVNGPDTDSALFYRTSRIQFLQQVIAAAGSTSGTDQPRHTMRYDMRPVGFTGELATLSIYSVHMKAASDSTSQNRRQLEAQRIVNDVAALPAGRQFLLAGDLNIQSSNQTAYQTLTRSLNNYGPFIDPIATPGSWENNSNFRFVHTQDPAFQMDSRFDQILVAATLLDGRGLDYIGLPNVVYSTSTWNDPNHSYRSYGNDGTSYNQLLKTSGNAMVGASIAQDLIDSALNGGHLPVYADFRVPSRMTLLTPSVHFGKMAVGQTSTVFIDLIESADTERWGPNGVTPLNVSFTLPTGITVRPRERLFWERRRPWRYTFDYTPTSVGSKSGNITLTSDDPAAPTVQIPWAAEVR